MLFMFTLMGNIKMDNNNDYKCDKQDDSCGWFDGECCITEDGQILCDKHYEEYLQEQETSNENTIK